jgi:hypothetical protein
MVIYRLLARSSGRGNGIRLVGGCGRVNVSFSLPGESRALDRLIYRDYWQLKHSVHAILIEGGPR